MPGGAILLHFARKRGSKINDEKPSTSRTHHIPGGAVPSRNRPKSVGTDYNSGCEMDGNAIERKISHTHGLCAHDSSAKAPRLPKCRFAYPGGCGSAHFFRVGVRGGASRRPSQPAAYTGVQASSAGPGPGSRNSYMLQVPLTGDLRSQAPEPAGLVRPCAGYVGTRGGCHRQRIRRNCDLSCEIISLHIRGERTGVRGGRREHSSARSRSDL